MALQGWHYLVFVEKLLGWTKQQLMKLVIRKAGTKGYVRPQTPYWSQSEYLWRFQVMLVQGLVKREQKL